MINDAKDSNGNYGSAVEINMANSIITDKIINVKPIKVNSANEGEAVNFLNSDI